MIFFMITLIFTAVIGLLIAYLTIQNTGQITLHAIHLTFNNVPIYALALGSFLTGLFLATMFNTFDALEGLLHASRKRKHNKGITHQSDTHKFVDDHSEYIPTELLEKETKTTPHHTFLRRLKHRFSI